MKKRRIIIDADPGIDDALAILLAIASPDISLEAITVVNGNCSVDQGVQNTLSILELTDATHIPVARGSSVPLVKPLLLAPETHGNTGIGYAQLPTPKIKPSQQHAVNLIIDTIMSSPGEISVVAIGPLTNLALALRLEPRIAQAVQEVFIMGGAINFAGNTTPQAEFNTYCDPHAAHIVYHSGMPITLAPLDVTYHVIITQLDVDQLLEHKSPISTFIAEATRFYMEFHKSYQKIQGCVINDPLALALTIRPDFVETQDLYVDVDINSGVSMGKTFADFFNITDQAANIKVALSVQARDFIEFFKERMINLSLLE
jgi:purine nucleosidase